MKHIRAKSLRYLANQLGVDCNCFTLSVAGCSPSLHGRTMTTGEQRLPSSTSSSSVERIEPSIIFSPLTTRRMARALTISFPRGIITRMARPVRTIRGTPVFRGHYRQHRISVEPQLSPLSFLPAPLNGGPTDVSSIQDLFARRRTSSETACQTVLWITMNS